ILDIDYDDGFVAYLNGVEIARANINGVPPLFNSGTIQDHEAKMYAGGVPDRFIIDNQVVLINGDNVLSVQAHNISNSSSDLTLIPFLSAIFSTLTSDGVPLNPILRLPDSYLHTNFKISNSETLVLSDNFGTIIDELYVDELRTDISLGTSILNDNLAYYYNPTPKAENSSKEYLGVINTKVAFSNSGGVVGGAFSLTLSGNSDDETIRYTTDVTEPNETTLLYVNPIYIDENTVVRARICKKDYISSFTNSKTFLFSVSHNLPVISLVTDPYNLFDQQYGIYEFGDSYDPNVPYFGANFWEDWERPVQFSFYEKGGSLGVEFNGGLKIFGGWSRANNQRSFSIFARDKYGLSEIDYSLFPDVPYDKYQSVVLRNSGNDWLKTMIRDAALTGLMKGSGLDFQAYNPTVTYINGEYWGIYNLRERISEHFLASKHNIESETIDLLENNCQVINGDNQEYLSLIEYVNITDLSLDENFVYVENEIDVDNYILYQLSQIYFSNTDWPGSNIKYWKSPNGKWRWILFDTDFGFGIWDVNDYKYDALSFALEENGPAWPNPPWSTLLFRKLIENISFRNRFVNRFADELNTRFLPQNVNSHIQSTFDVISSEIDSHFERWSASYDPGQLQNMKTFGINRPTYIKDHLINRYNFSEICRITIVNSDFSQGYVRLNENLRIQSDSWSGDYFKEVPVTLKAIPEIGYEFSHWSGISSSTNPEIEISLQDAVSAITPNFIQSTSGEKAIVINEINYKSGNVNDANDWIELHNPNGDYLDVSNWIFKDNNDDNLFKIAEGTAIEAFGYLVIARDSSDFADAFSDVTNFIGDFSFGLSANGDAVRIYNSNSELQDEVYFLPIEPWPVCANGQGPSLELISPDLDNTLSKSWSCLSDFGSPGVKNAASAIEIFRKDEISVFPNPIHDYLYIKGLSGNVLAQVFDLGGRQVLTKTINDRLYLGGLKSGMYILKLVSNNQPYVFKIVKE
ncbi:MAG: CotH kinase family protein, partial [Bacteroidales bacterium]|nr:CotH kinase family protein [Bacteroidales bacterium]